MLFGEPPEKPGPNARVTDLGEFAVDPDRASKDVQLILAVVRPKTCLAETWDYTRAKIREYASAVPKARSISLTDTLLVPNINWRVAHHFKELEKTSFQNPPLASLPIVQAEQSIAFRLDRNGAQLSSEAKLAVAAIPTHYTFDRPFLVVMKKRTAQRPFFVIWVDNAELLSPVR